MTVRWGIAGLGRVAELAAAALGYAHDSRLVAVGSRAVDRAAEFAWRHGVDQAHAHGSYAALCADPDVDAIYLASPNAQHADMALAAIGAGKAVLVEKAFTTTVADTQRVVDAARAAGVFCMEAMWTRFNPGVVELRRLIDEGAIGDLRGIHGDLTAFRAYAPDDRLFAPELGGGAVLDLGVYVLSFVQHLMGTPSMVHAVGGRLPNGVDGEFSALLGYPDGRSATVSAGFTAHGPGRMMLLGTRGWIDVHPRFHRAPALTVWRDGQPEMREFANGFQFEFEHVAECLRAGRTESPVMPLEDTITVQRLMAQVLSQIA